MKWLSSGVVALVATALLSVTISQDVVEEFHAHGPMEFHDLAINKFLEMKKADPTQNLSHDSAFLQLATKHAVKRLSRKPDEEFELRVSVLQYTTYFLL